MLYTPADIVIVPFPFLERPAHKYRPALVFGRAATPAAPLYWLAMFTSQTDDSWPDDILVEPSTANGLQKSSLLRCAKVTAVPENLIVQKLGVLDAATMKRLQGKLLTILAAS